VRVDNIKPNVSLCLLYHTDMCNELVGLHLRGMTPKTSTIAVTSVDIEAVVNCLNHNHMPDLAYSDLNSGLSALETLTLTTRY